ncbi:MAG: hypothetical protein ACK5MV_05230 [Aminipila sp.]
MFIPGNWIIQKDKIIAKHEIKDTEIYKENVKELPLENQFTIWIKNNWQLAIIGITALIALIKN